MRDVPAEADREEPFDARAGEDVRVAMLAMVRGLAASVPQIRADASVEATLAVRDLA